MFNEEPLTPEEIESLWVKAAQDGANDMAEVYFLVSQYLGEARLKRIGRRELYEKTKTLPDYHLALESVKRGCQRFCEFELGIKIQDQNNDWVVKQMLCIESVRRAQNDKAKEERMQRHALTFMAALLRRDLDFFRKLGAALTALPPKTFGEHELAHTLVTYWLTDFLWLMDAKTLAAAVAKIHKVKEPANFTQTVKRMKARDRWDLYSTKPALICGFKDRGEFEFTATGKKLLFPK